MNIGILGGAFDPIHYGHLAICKSALELLPLQKIFIIPSFNHPFKGDKSFFSFEQRCELINLALSDFFSNNNQITVNEIEKQTPGENFSYQILEKLHKQNPKNTFYFFLGTDNLKAIHLWKNIEQVIQQAKLVCFNRKGYDFQNIIESIETKNTQATMSAITQIHFSIDLPDVSSTDLRNKIKNKQSIEGLTPYSVIKKIHDFYK